MVASRLRQNTADLAMPSTAVLISRRMFPTCAVAGIADMSPSIASFIAVKAIEGLFAMTREWSVIPVTRIEAIIYMAIKSMWSVKPWSGTNE